MKIKSIFLSVDGEVNMCGQGGWSVFIRFAGCSALCDYCDSKYTWGREGSTDMLIGGIIKEVERIGKGVKKVTITGGEPFEQRSAVEGLIYALLKESYLVTVETNGLHWVDKLAGKSPNLGFVMDYKLPSAGPCSGHILLERFYNLSDNDYIKFLIGTMRDFQTATDAVEKLYPLIKARMYFAPVHGKVNPIDLFNLMKRANLPPFQVGINMQLHKYIFPEDWRAEEVEE